MTLLFSPAEPAHLLLRVSDTGTGIPEEHRSKVFEEFHRIPGSEGQEGTGLGLSIVRQLVDVLGGTIHVDCEPGRGATFEVTLPRGFDPAEANEGPT